MVIAARREGKLEEVADEIKSAGGEAFIVAGDVSKVCLMQDTLPRQIHEVAAHSSSNSLVLPSGIDHVPQEPPA